MAKCSKCGKKGLFLKIGADGLCRDCHLAYIESLISDKEKLLQEAKEAAKTEADRYIERQRATASSELEITQKKLEAVRNQLDKLEEEKKENEKALALAKSRVGKLKPLANSIKHYYETFLLDPSKVSAQDIISLDIENLLEEPQLNCLSMKTLAAKYRNIRKRIIEVCKDYESRYTTKANAAIYKLMVLALEAELENTLVKLQYGKLEAGVAAVRELTTKYYNIAAEGNQTIASTLKRFIAQIESLYIDVIETEYEYYVQRERAKEEQRALREQMRQEAEEKKRLEQERKKVENEEKKYNNEIERITAELQTAQAAEIEKLNERLAELNNLLLKVEERKADIINLQNGKAGTVYIISNLGAFGDHVFKIGMTRRLEPQDRIDELGNASVPFPFDVHSFIFSQDAVSLEKELHMIFNERRVNKVNLRKEFFDVSIDEIRAEVERIDPTAPFHITMEAMQYRQSQSIDEVGTGMVVDLEEDE